MDPVVRKDLMQTPLELCKAAIEAGDKQEAIKQAQLVWDEVRPLHDMLVEMSGLMATYIRDKLGEEAVQDMWRWLGELLWKPVLMQFKDAGGPEVLAQVYASFLRAHGHEFTAVEDDEKFSFIMHYCGSGGFLMREGMHEGCTRSPLDIGITKTEAEWTFNRPLSVYCVHTPLWMDMQPREWGWDVFKSEFGRQFDDEGKPIDEPCVAMIYKKAQS